VEAVCTAASNNGSLRITNGAWEVEAADGAARIRRYGRDFFAAGRNLELRVVEDPWGSWGGMNEEKDSYSLDEVREIWKLTASEILEPGPLRAKLWTRWQGKNSWIDLTFSVAAGSPLLRVEGRMLWNERSARLKLVLPSSGELLYDVPAGRVTRNVEGQVPAGRWVARSRQDGRMGVASDVLSDFNATADELAVTLARATRYAADVPYPPGKNVWEPATDCGELKFQLAFFDQGTDGDQAADTLTFPPTALLSAPAKGPWGRQGSLGQLSPESLRLLSLEAIPSGKLKLRIQNRGESQQQASVRIGEKETALGPIGSQEIKTWVLEA
jgi:alpha-mannosidase